MLGVKCVAQLAGEEPEELYRRLSKITGQRQDPCVLDVFCAAVAQARDPELPSAAGAVVVLEQEAEAGRGEEQKPHSTKSALNGAPDSRAKAMSKSPPRQLRPERGSRMVSLAPE